MVNTLKTAELETSRGVEDLIAASGLLQNALHSQVDQNLQQMQAVSERMATLGEYSNEFANRLLDFLKKLFFYQSEACLIDESRFATKTDLKLQGHEHIHDLLFTYRRLILWLKDVDPRKHTDLQVLYVSTMKEIYQKELKVFFDSVRSNISSRRTNDEPAYSTQLNYNFT